MTVVFHREFSKEYRKLPIQVKKRFKQRLGLFIQDEFDPNLNNHPLKGKYQGYRSVNVTGDIRAIYKKDRSTAIFVTIGSHSKLYD